MDVLLWQAMCGHNTNGSVGLQKHTHKLKQQFSLADQRVVKTVTVYFCNFPLLLVLVQLNKYLYCPKRNTSMMRIWLDDLKLTLWL